MSWALTDTESAHSAAPFHERPCIGLHGLFALVVPVYVSHLRLFRQRSVLSRSLSVLVQESTGRISSTRLSRWISTFWGSSCSVGSARYHLRARFSRSRSLTG